MNTYYTTQFVGSAPPVPVGIHRPAPTARFGKLAQQLHEILVQGASLDDAATAILRVVEQHTRCLRAGVFRILPDGTLHADQQIGVADPEAKYVSDFESVVRASLQRACPVGLVLDDTSQQAAMAIPIRAPGSQALVLAACTALGELDMAGLAVVLESAAGALTQLVTHDNLQRLEWESQVAAAACDLASRILACESYEQSLILTVNELKRFFQCQQVSVATTRRNRPGLELRAVSGLSEFDKSAAPIRSIAAALDEVAVRNSFTLWPAAEGHSRHATLALRKLAEGNRVDAIVGIPLATADEQLVGTIVAEGVRSIVHEPRQLAAWRALAPHIAEALRSRRLMDKRLWEHFVLPRQHRQRRRMVIAAALALAALGSLPVPHRIVTESRVEPVVRRFVVAPYSGRLRDSRVEPGDLVESGHVLATMDDRELSFELASLAAERYRAAKERDTAMAEHDHSAAQIAALEMERLDAKIALLRERTKNLEIVSPLAGIVLKGDLQDAEGAPVNIGQALFEVAPLDPIELELAIPADDIGWARPDQSVTARLDGFHHSKLTGVVRIIHPRAEIRDGKNVFIANVTITNPGQQLRPGMNGRAWIRAGSRPLVWIWLHKAIHRLRMLTGW